jgi:predicted nucleotidyltransferase
LKVNKEEALLFLRKKLTNEYIVRAFLFGSFVKDKEEPSDCDVFIITNQTPLTDKWKEFIGLIESIKIEFLEIYGLPLNTSVNTKKEFTEESAFRARITAKKIIEII